MPARKENMLDHNKRMREFLADNGIIVTPKYISTGSLRGCWRLYGSDKWYGNKDLQNKLTQLGFLDFDGKKLTDFSGNGGKFSIFAIYKRLCKRCGDELTKGDDLICGYHYLED